LRRSLAFATLPGTNFSALGVPFAFNSALIDAGASAEVRYGSFADMAPSSSDICSTPESGH
jgi:hypothetical protein